jgi:hypothetical protein
MEQEQVLSLISQRGDGVWEVRDQDGAVIELCGKRPGPVWFLWALLMEARKQTELLRKIEAATESTALVAENIDYRPLLERIAEKVGVANE